METLKRSILVVSEVIRGGFFACPNATGSTQEEVFPVIFSLGCTVLPTCL